jgi:hypothetical protein
VLFHRPHRESAENRVIYATHYSCRRSGAVFKLALCDFCHGYSCYEGADWGGAQAMRGGSIFVLTVDDDAAFARAAARSFESVGMRTFLALDPAVPFDGSEAIDVIVTNRAGEPRSLALAELIKKRAPRGPIILMSAQPDTFRRPQAEQEPWQPLEIAELCRMIKVRQTH